MILKLSLILSLFLSLQTQAQQNSVPTSQEVLKTKQYAPVVKSGLREAQIGVSQQNVLKPEDAQLNKAYQLEKLQQQAKDAASSDALTRAQQFNLGAEVLPFVAPWINEIAQECMKNVSSTDGAQQTAAAACSQQAVAQFQKNPAAFIEKLSPADKARLEALVERRTRESERRTPAQNSSP